MGTEKSQEEMNEKIRNEKWNQLSNSITLICNQDQTIWNIFGYFFGTNALLLIALFSNGEFPKDPLVGIILSLIGISLSLLWRFIQKRAIGHLKRFESIQNKMEELLQLEPDECLTGSINKTEYEKFIGLEPGKARVWIVRSCTIVFLIWMTALIFFIVQYKCPQAL